MRFNTLVVVGLLAISQSALALTVGFSQGPSKSNWDTALREEVSAEAQKRGIDLKFTDGQRNHADQIRAVRGMLAQGVDAIIIDPVQADGWDVVLLEVRRTRIPVILLNGGISADPLLYRVRIGANFEEEGKKVGKWLMDKIRGKCNIVELQGTALAMATIDRAKGFRDAVGGLYGGNISRSLSADFTQAKGHEVMADFLRSEDPTRICALFSHSDEMALGAIEAIKEAGLKPGKDILVVSVGGIPEYFKAMAHGEANITVERAHHLGAQAYDMVEKILAGEVLGTGKFISTTGDVFGQDTAAAEYDRRSKQSGHEP